MKITIKDYYDHTYMCGSRTKKCEFCQGFITFKEFENHFLSCSIKQNDIIEIKEGEIKENEINEINEEIKENKEVF